MGKISASLDRFWNRMIFFMEQSLLGRLILGIARGITGAIAHSRFFQFLAGDRIYNAAERSCIGRLVRWIFGLFERLGDKLGKKLVEKSLIIRCIGTAIHELSYLSASAVGCFLVFAALPLLQVNKILFAGAEVLALILLLLPQSLYGLAVQSRIVRLISGVQEQDGFEIESRRRNIQRVVCGVLGLLFFGLSCVIGPLYTAALYVAVAGGIALIYMPDIGIFACVFFAPFLPTMVLAGMLGITLVCFLLQLMSGSGRYSFKIDVTGIFLVAFMGMLLFFGVTSYDPATSIKIALLECLFICSYFLIFFLVDNRKKIRYLIFTYCGSALITGLIGLRQYLSGAVDTTWTDTELFEGLQLRIYSTFENPNVYGEYLLLCIPMAVAMIFLAQRWVMKLFYAGTATLLLINLALTYSRGCYLAILLAMAVVIWFGARRLVALGVVGLFALPFVLPKSILTRFTSITNLTDSSTSYRINIWQGTVRMLEDFWPLGVGLGQQAYNTVYPLYGLNAIFAPHAHSLFLQVMSEMGIAGFAILMCFCFAFLSTVYVAYKKSKGTRTMWFAVAMMAAIVAFLFEGFFEYIWYNYRVFLLFFITMGIVSALCRRVIREGELTFD